MIRRSISLLLLAFFCLHNISQAQTDSYTLSKDEYLSAVKKYHPLIKQQSLKVERSKADLQSARGSFDPVLSSGLNRKSFDGKLYYSYFNPQVSIPTWYGVELKAGLEEIIGDRVSPESTFGQTSYAGVKLSANQLYFDKRRAVLRQAQSMLKLSEAERLAAINDVIYESAAAYWNWAREYRMYQIIENAVSVNEERLRFVKIEYQQGSRPAIDTTEAEAQLRNFYLQKENAWLSFQNAGLELANFLWLENGEPLNWSPQIVPPDSGLLQDRFIPELEALLVQAKTAHPKLLGLSSKINVLETEKKLKAQSLIPKLSINANVLNKGYDKYPDITAAYLENNYKLGVDFSVPLLMREARGAYKSAGLKLGETFLEKDLTAYQIENKVKTYFNEVVQLDKQITINEGVLKNYQALLQGEKIRFENGESTLFILNSRENKVLEVAQKLNELRAKWNKSYAGLMWAAGILAE